jgi:hypothetical protein
MEDTKSEQDDDFVKNIEEESNEEDDVEVKIQTTIAAYNKQKKEEIIPRPESAGNNRVATATRKVADSAKVNVVTFKDADAERKAESAQPRHIQFKQDINVVTSKKDHFYERFNEMVKINHIAPEDFWNPAKQKLNSDEFKDCLDIMGFKFTNDEFEDVIFDITDADFFVTMSAFAKKIECWKLYSTKHHDTNSDALDMIKDSTLKMALESKKKMFAEKQKRNILIRPMSTHNLGSSAHRPFSGISAISGKSKLTTATMTHDPDNRLSNVAESMRPMPVNKSNYYLKKAKEKETKVDEILAITVNRGKNEYEYECLIKMGESNEMSQIIGENFTYRAYKKADGTLKCRVYELDKAVKELTMKELNREHARLKMKVRQHQNLKIWDILMQEKKGTKVFSSFKTVVASNHGAHGDDAKDGKDGKEKSGSKREIQNELKKVLFKTMQLTDQLKNQLKKLENSGLVYNQ